MLYFELLALLGAAVRAYTYDLRGMNGSLNGAVHRSARRSADCSASYSVDSPAQVVREWSEEAGG